MVKVTLLRGSSLSALVMSLILMEDPIKFLFVDEPSTLT